MHEQSTLLSFGKSEEPINRCLAIHAGIGMHAASMRTRVQERGVYQSEFQHPEQRAV